MRKFSKNTIDKAKKKIKAHYLNLSIHAYLESRKFELFCMEFDVDNIWNSIIENFNTKYLLKEGFQFSKNDIPNYFVDDMLGIFLGTIFDKDSEKFLEVVPEMLRDYSEWNQKNPNSESLEKDLVWMIRGDCLDFGFDPENDVMASFELAGFGNNYFDDDNSQETKKIEVPNNDCRFGSSIPIEINESLKKFKDEYPNSQKIAFIMMQFGKSESHKDILKSIRDTLFQNGCIGLRADDKEYHNDVYYNILTYIYGCGFGIAVFDIIDEKSFNPNVSLEVGYLLALRKQVCLLKEKSLKTLQSDLVGKLYREFSIDNCDISIGNELNNWLDDKGLRGTPTNPDEDYNKLRSYLINIAFKEFNISKNENYSYAKDLVYGSIQKFKPEFLEVMKKMGFVNSDYSLTEVGSLFIRNTLADYLLGHL